LGSGVYDAWEKKDLIWAVYSYFTWKTPVKSETGVLEAIYGLAMLASLAKPADGSNVIPVLLHTYEALSLREAVIPAAAELAKKKYGDRPLCKASGAGDLMSVKALLDAGYRELEEKCYLYDNDGYTPLEIASEEGHFLIVQELFKAGANVHACVYKIYIVEEDIDYGHMGVETCRRKKTFRMTSYQLAARKNSDNHKRICEALLAAGADPTTQRTY